MTKILKVYDAQKKKNQRLTHQNEISKISSIDLKIRCVDTNRSNVMSNMKPNEKLQRYCTQVFFCGRSYVYISIIEMGHII